MAILLPRTFNISLSEYFITSIPSRKISPLRNFAGGSGRMRSMDLAMVVFPAPVSPTRPRVSPFFMSKETPLTAWTIFLPEVYTTFRSRTESNTLFSLRTKSSAFHLTSQLRIKRITKTIAHQVYG